MTAFKQEFVGSEAAKQYIENCKRNGTQSENKPRKDALYPMHGCQIYIDDKIDPLLDELNKFHENLDKAGFYTKWPSNGAFLEELKSLPKSSHDDSQDVAALASPPTAGILGAAAVLSNPKLKEKMHVDIPREPDIFKPTKSMLDILSERIDSDLNKRLTEFGETNGFSVVFVFYQTLKNENGVSKATCDIKMYKRSDMHDALDFARHNAGELGIFDPPKSKEVERLEKERDYWKSRCLREEDDGDTLGIFRHWND